MLHIITETLIQNIGLLAILVSFISIPKLISLAS